MPAPQIAPQLSTSVLWGIAILNKSKIFEVKCFRARPMEITLFRFTKTFHTVYVPFTILKAYVRLF